MQVTGFGHQVLLLEMVATMPFRQPSGASAGMALLTDMKSSKLINSKIYCCSQKASDIDPVFIVGFVCMSPIVAAGADSSVRSNFFIGAPDHSCTILVSARSVLEQDEIIEHKTINAKARLALSQLMWFLTIIYPL